VRIPDSLRPSLAGILAAVLSSIIVGGLRRYLDLELDAEAGVAVREVSAFVADAILAGTLGAWGAFYAFFQKLFASWFNPTDAASPHLAQVAAVPKGDGARTMLAATLMQNIGQPLPSAIAKEVREPVVSDLEIPPRVDSER
jgi:hypothetical protein